MCKDCLSRGLRQKNKNFCMVTLNRFNLGCYHGFKNYPFLNVGDCVHLLT